MLEKPHPLLSIIVPSIRSEKLPGLYESIKNSFSSDFELIIISPNPKIPEFIDNQQIYWIESWANPTVCQQMGLLSSFGEYVCFGWDDGLYEAGAIDHMFLQLSCQTNSDFLPNNIAISGRYIEGDIAPAYMTSDKYYVINTHDRASSPYITNDFLLLNTGIIKKKDLLAIGGFDCRFETTGLSAVDMAIRLQLFGVKVVLSEGVVLKCTWLPGDEGDHGPINEASEDDFSLLHKKYRQPIFHKRIIIDAENYKLQPKVWERRFK